MTDVRLPEKWLSDRRFLRLSDGALRLFVTALMWSVSNRTDGVVEEIDLRLMPAVDASKADELENVGLWAVRPGGWLITDFLTTQTSRSELEVLDNARRREREKKQRQRAKRASEEARKVDVPGDGPRGHPRGRVPGTAQEGRQEGRKDATTATTNPPEPSKLAEPPRPSWPETARPGRGVRLADAEEPSLFGVDEQPQTAGPGAGDVT